MIRRSSLLIGALALLAAACSNDRPATAPLAPDAPHAAIIPTTVIGQAVGLPRTAPASGQPVSFTINGSRSYRFAVPGAGLTVEVPAGAIAAGTSLTITATPVAGSTVAYEFEPHGTIFLHPIRVTQSLAGTALPAGAHVEGAYLPSPDALDPLSGIASVAEFLPATVDPKSNTVSFDVWHFSGYMISVGRK